MPAKKRPAASLIELAMYYAEQDRRSYADANSYDPVTKQKANALADEFRAYREKRWGLMPFEIESKPVKVLSINEFLKNQR